MPIKNKNKLLPLFILISSFIFCTSNSNMSILSPYDLMNKFPNKEVDIVIGKLGLSTDFYIRGEIIFDNTTNHTACEELKNINHLNLTNEENFKILLAYRGNCPFSQKARNAQNAGYSMIILINGGREPIQYVIMNDENANDIYIPVGLISEQNGKIILETKNKIIVEINFSNKEIFENVELKFFFSSSEPRAYKLIDDLTQYIDKFKNQVIFKPIYVVHQNPYYSNENPKSDPLCLSRGKYCYFPKSTTIIQDGRKILMEDLRQKCIYNKNKKNIKVYYNYIKNFNSECMKKDFEKFNEYCSKNVLENIGLPLDYLDKCLANSFNVDNLLSTSYVDNENNILKKEYEEILKYSLTTFPAVVINNKTLLEAINEVNIVTELCNNVKIKPDFCSYITGLTDKHIQMTNTKKFWVYFLVVVLIMINISMFFICRKYIITLINDKIKIGSIDIDGRIRNLVNNYFTLKQNGQDYKAFSSYKDNNNGTKIMEMQNKSQSYEGSVNTI